MKSPLLTGDADDPYAARLVGFPVAKVSDEPAGPDALELLVSRYVDAVRAGTAPSLETYVRQYPAFAKDLRELLPFVGTLEEWSVNKEVDIVRSNVLDNFQLHVIGEYQVVREIGRGGMGIVFEAIHPTTRRRVAIKLLPLRYVADLPRRRELFQREAATIAKVRHQNIVPVYYFGEHEGYCYYVMQLVDGVNLEWVIDRLRRDATPLNAGELRRAGRGDELVGNNGAAIDPQGLGRESWHEFAKIGVQVCQALAHTHQLNVLHNDIKPANLILDGTGRVVVTDFGVGARWEAEFQDSEQHAVGTLRYMAPERVSGQADARGDIYSLGVTLYELLTRKSAFAADNRGELLEQVLKCSPTPIREVNRSVPKPLATIIAKAMQPIPEDRYPTANALRGDLLRYLHGQRIQARLPRRGPAPFSWLRFPGRSGR